MMSLKTDVSRVDRTHVSEVLGFLASESEVRHERVQAKSPVPIVPVGIHSIYLHIHYSFGHKYVQLKRILSNNNRFLSTTMGSFQLQRPNLYFQVQIRPIMGSFQLQYESKLKLSNSKGILFIF